MPRRELNEPTQKPSRRMMSITIDVPAQHFLNLSEVCAFLQFDQDAVLKWLSRGRFPPPIRIGETDVWAVKAIGLWLACVELKCLSLEDTGQQETSDGRYDPRKVYFIRVNDRVKIGSAHNPVSRMRSLQTGSAEKLEILHTVGGGYTEESRLHALFAADRLGGEWFNLTEEIRDYIDGLKATQK